MEVVSICDGSVSQAFSNNDVFWVQNVVKLDLGLIREMDTESLKNAEQNKLFGESACGERKYCCTMLKSCLCCCLGW